MNLEEFREIRDDFRKLARYSHITLASFGIGMPVSIALYATGTNMDESTIGKVLEYSSHVGAAISLITPAIFWVKGSRVYEKIRNRALEKGFEDD